MSPEPEMLLAGGSAMDEIWIQEKHFLFEALLILLEPILVAVMTRKSDPIEGPEVEAGGT